MLLADAMSRCPSYSSEEIKLDMRVDYIAFNKTWIAKLKEAIWEDPILSTVYQLTQQGMATPKEAYLPGWPGHTGTSGTNCQPQMMACY